MNLNCNIRCRNILLVDNLECTNGNMSIGDLKWKQQDNRLIGAVLDDQKLEHIDNFMSVRFLIIHWQPLIGTN